MIAQPLDLLRHFFTNVLLKGQVSGNHGAAEHEVLPHHDAEFVADIVEVIGFVVAAAPIPDHVHVSIARRLENLAMLSRSDAGGETVERNDVSAFGEYRNAIHHEREALPPL